MWCYKILLWLLCCANSGAFVIHVTPDELLQKCSKGQIQAIFRSFTVDQANLYRAAQVLRLLDHDYHYLYVAQETEERSAALLSYVSDKTLHDTIFSADMVFANPDWTDAFFLSKKLKYYGNIFDEPLELPPDKIIRWQIMEHAMATQAENMQSFDWIDELLGPNPTEDMALRIFEMFGLENITSDVMGRLGRAGKGERLLTTLFSKLRELSRLDQLVGRMTVEGAPMLTLMSEGAKESIQDFIHDRDGEPLYTCWDTLQSNYSGRTDRSYWELMVSAGMDDWYEEKDSTMLCWVAEFVPKDGLYNWTMGDLIAECAVACKAFVDRLVAITPPSFIPMSLMPPETCRQTWLRKSPFHVYKRLFDADDMLAVSEVISENQLLPLNWTFQGKPIGRAIIDNVKSLIYGGKALGVDEVIQILQSWPYLILEKEKLGFSFMFPTKKTPNKWKVWATELFPGNSTLSDMLETELKSLCILGSLTPKDIRRMVDSSYQWCEEAENGRSASYESNSSYSDLDSS
ncbi:hypothetical protein PSACC_02005 [Paramicrosporidium saccamoebae]|uniref:Uncharacterized protein n=1 Tax=Paramicrosporidium saccamoebae TaxID=1246581 RepID=A0A2H9TKD5_9FUNG|nr:hypothetical protein PSACC_02005 [Paramicrosporidium saccamoebae]